MSESRTSTRRQFMSGTLGGFAGYGLAASGSLAAYGGLAASGGLHALAAEGETAVTDPSHSYPGRGHIYKAVKWGMVRGNLTVLEKFQLCQELGYDGMELNSPVDATAEEIQAATVATGMPVHGLVDMRHWQLRLSSPDEKQRDQGREILLQAIRDCKAFGGSTVLLVPGKVTGPDENSDHVWKRSIVEIRKVLPLASRLGIRVLIENVWNGFCESPDEMRDYLDEIDSPWVGAYFDIGNAQNFAPSQNWIRTLGRRIVKLDVKGWGLGMPKHGFCKIGDGTIDWLAVQKALAEIRYSGWCTAEVAGGGRERLADIAARVDKVLQL